MSGYFIYKLNAKKIIDYMQTSKNKAGEAEYTLKADLSDVFERGSVVIGKEKHNLIAAFYQIFHILYDRDEKKNKPEFSDWLKGQSRNALETYIVEMDFSDIMMWERVTEDSPVYKLIDRGIDIIFPGNEEKRFITYDRSNSMAREKKLYFLDESLVSDLHKRLMLDIKDIYLLQSKLYSYRGLYYTDARRIGGLELNENTVVVIKDLTKVILGCKQWFTRLEENVFGVESSDDEDTKELMSEPFDGVGLISPEYADIINRQLGEDSNSFQIRLPFGKGLLHKADWQELIREMCAEGVDYEDLTIQDAFKIDRKLSDIRIIMPQSMFKCKHWIQNYCNILKKLDGVDVDPMQYYFEKFREYDHALYISGTDSTFINSGEVFFNYQLINPLAMNTDTFKGLVNRHFERAELVDPENFYSFDGGEKEVDTREIMKLFTWADVPVDEENVSTEEEEDNEFAWIRVLGQRPRLARDPYISERLKSKRDSLVRNAVKGRIFVEGEQRYLCCDFVALMQHIIWQINGFRENIDEGKLNELRTSKLGEAEVYAPGMEWLDGKKVALFRNPHLSRNEECLALFRDKRKGGYYKYFSHLKNVVMVGKKSPIALTLGGADFDGDIVKVISQKEIVDSVEYGLYGRTDAKKLNERLVPVIKIPGSNNKGSSIIEEKTDPGIVFDTFAGRVGIISNKAIRIGILEYSGTENERELLKDKCAVCTILTGLDIDAVKTGQRPSLKLINEIKLGKNLDKDNKDRNMDRYDRDYIEEMKTMISIHGSVNINNEGNAFEISAPGHKKRRIKIMRDGEEYCLANIEQLPLMCADHIIEDEQTDKDFEKTKEEFLGDRELIDFLLGYDTEGWREALDQKDSDHLRLEILSRMIKDRKIISNAAREKLKQVSAASDNEVESHIYTLLTMRYDSLDQVIVRNGDFTVTVEQALKNACSDIRAALKYQNKAEECIKRIKDSGWIFTPKADRKGRLEAIIDPGGRRGFKKNIKPGTVELLTSFKNQNFELLEKVVDFVKGDLPAGNRGKEADEKYKDNIFFDVYKEAVTDNIPLKDWDEMLTQAVREQIAALFNCSSEDISQAVKYAVAFRKQNGRKKAEMRWKIDKDGDFMWTVFTPDEINNAVLEAGEANVR